MNHAGMCFPGIFGLAYLLGKTCGWVVQPLAGVAYLTILVIWWLPPVVTSLGWRRAELDDFEAAIPKKTFALRSRGFTRSQGVAKRYQLETLI